jgi:hypothetical protein
MKRINLEKLKDINVFKSVNLNVIRLLNLDIKPCDIVLWEDRLAVFALSEIQLNNYIKSRTVVKYQIDID